MFCSLLKFISITKIFWSQFNCRLRAINNYYRVIHRVTNDGSYKTNAAKIRNEPLVAFKPFFLFFLFSFFLFFLSHKLQITLKRFLMLTDQPLTLNRTDEHLTLYRTELDLSELNGTGSNLTEQN